MYFDIHAHLDYIEDVDEVIQRAKDAGVVKIVTAGINSESNRKALVLSKKYDIVECSLGIYPNEYVNIDEEISFIKLHKNEIVGIGEVGLDFSEEGNHEKQEEVFIRMIHLANELNLPLIVHSRKAEDRVLELLEQERAKKVVLHCFCGKKPLIEKGIQLGYYFSIPANLSRAQNFQGLVEKVNINQLLTETDTPYLAPVKGESSEPKDVVGTVKNIAEIKGFEEEETKKNLFLNYQNLIS